MRLYLLRHGETEGNALGINQGHQQGKLNERGEEQARRVAQRLQDERFDVIIVSDLQRTKQTAEPIITTHPEARVIYDPRVRERNQGVFEGTPIGSFKEHVEKIGADIVTYQPEGGESIAMARERARLFLASLIAERKGKTVLVVSHGGFLSQLLFILLKKEGTSEDYAQCHPRNAALSLFRIKDGGEHEVELLNCVQHL